MKAIIIKIFSVACIAFCWVSHNQLNAQLQVDYKKNGDQYFAAKDYYSAAIYYEQYLGKNKKSGRVLTIPYTIQKQQSSKLSKSNSKELKLLEVYCRIGDCYRFLHHYSEAKKWYQLPATTDAFVMAKLWLGVCEKATQQLDSASKYLQAFVKQYFDNDAFKQLAKSELASLHFIEQQLKNNEMKLYSINRLPINSNSADYAATIVKDSIYFTSSRPDSFITHSRKIN